MGEGGDICGNVVHMGNPVRNLGEHDIGLVYIFINMLEDLTGGGNFLGVVLYVGHALAGLLYHVGDL